MERVSILDNNFNDYEITSSSFTPLTYQKSKRLKRVTFNFKLNKGFKGLLKRPRVN